MSTVIYYYTGTGNSLWTARVLADQIGGADLIPMATFSGAMPADKYDSIGLVFPVHMWGIPGFVINFLAKLEKNPNNYYFAAAVNAGQVSNTLIQLKNILKKNGITLATGIDIVLPSNYIPWGGPGPANLIQKRIKAAENKLKLRADTIKMKKQSQVDKGPLWQRMLFTGLYKLTFNMIHKMDKDFSSDEKCDSCGICVKVCPVKNIDLIENRPVWKNNCEQCLSCIQWCPKEAIQYGKKTHAYERYHHPSVKLADIINSVK